MKILIEESNDQFIKFILQDTFISYANALRRILISEVPTVAIDLVEIEINNTSLPDEVISHRLGLIPLYLKKDLLYKSECTCLNSCDNCSINISLNISNNTDTPIVVTCKDLKSSDPVSIKPQPVICKLGTRQNIKVNCKAFKGQGKTHSKWSPVSVISYEYDSGNRSRSTMYWREKDYDNEEKEEDANLIDEINEVKMCVEVVEGFGRPIEILRKGLEIMKKKFETLRGDLIN
ncbi:DNA-directed RNA polymerase II subunit RPB3 (RPB3) [Vairimorpha necatrix]|uniref:DNA-directed RNA polymerase II subunit RPB3 (RPB3) n=1 Tax=Vairimorpha necatrix TaxID=6039 RepID=A0AAX4J9H3_9MICR